MKKYKQNAMVSSFFMLLSLFMIVYVIPNGLSIKAASVDSGEVANSRMLPYLSSAVILIASALEFIKNIYKVFILRKANDKKRESLNSSGMIRAFLIFVCCLLYVSLFYLVGYGIATIVAPTLMLVVLKDYNWKHYVSVYVVGGITYIIFQFILNVNIRLI